MISSGKKVDEEKAFLLKPSFPPFSCPSQQPVVFATHPISQLSFMGGGDDANHEKAPEVDG